MDVGGSCYKVCHILHRVSWPYVEINQEDNRDYNYTESTVNGVIFGHNWNQILLMLEVLVMHYLVYYF